MRWVVPIVVAVLGGGVALFIWTAPDPQPEGPTGRTLAQRGAHEIEELRTTLEDTSRPTHASDDFEGSASRRLDLVLRHPVDASAPLPAIVYSHGFGGSSGENARLLEHLTRRGFATVAADFPLTSRNGVAGPDVTDLVNQPADVRFIIDWLLSDDSPVAVDAERVGALGLSLGAMTTLLVTYHGRLRDGRIRAAAVLAPPAGMFDERFYTHGGTPLLAVAGDIDALLPYESNARGLLAHAPRTILATVSGGTHIGFSDAAAVLYRWLSNADSIACAFVGGADEAADVAWLEPLGGAQYGVRPDMGELPCQDELVPSIHPARQQLLARVAVTAFFEATLGDGPSDPWPTLAALDAENPALRVERR